MRALHPSWPNHVWTYDFVTDHTHDAWSFRMLTLIGEFTREYLVIDVARHLSSNDVLYQLAKLFIERGPPDFIRSDNGPEFAAIAVRECQPGAGQCELLIRASAYR
jgi:transposase InsO family protein